MSDTGTSELSSLLTQLNAYSTKGTPVRPPSPSEAMAIYSVAVRLVQLQVSVGDTAPVDPSDLAATRDVLLGTRRLLRAALDRLERVTPPNLVLIEGGASRH
jgi:hypothetical protein